MLISREAAQRRAADGIGAFDGNVKIHRSMGREAIPDTSGRCRFCDEGACRPLRVSRMISTAASHRRSGDPWQVMRIKGNRRGRKNNFTALIEREFDVRRIVGELRELSAEHPYTSSAVDKRAFFEEFSHSDLVVRGLELKRNLVRENEGPDAVTKLDAERKRFFVEALERLEANPGYARDAAEYVVKFRRLILPPVKAEVDDLAQYVGMDRAEQLHEFLNGLEDLVAQRRAERIKAFEKLRAERNKPLEKLRHRKNTI